MDAITYNTPVFIVKTNTSKQGSSRDKYKTCKDCSCPKENKVKANNDLLFAAMFIDLMSATIKQLGNQVKSLKKENAELREKLENGESNNLDLVA
jgi:hypothetical protein